MARWTDVHVYMEWTIICEYAADVKNETLAANGREVNGTITNQR